MVFQVMLALLLKCSPHKHITLPKPNTLICFVQQSDDSQVQTLYNQISSIYKEIEQRL